MYCINCGKEIETGARFCPHCGAEQEKPAPQQMPVAQSSAAAQTTAPPTVRKTHKKKNGKLILAGTAAALAAASAAALLVIRPYLEKQKQNRALKQGIEAYQAGDYDTAAQFYSEVLKNSPEDQQTLLLLAETELAQGKLEQAAEHMQLVSEKTLAKYPAVELVVDDKLWASDIVLPKEEYNYKRGGNGKKTTEWKWNDQITTFATGLENVYTLYLPNEDGTEITGWYYSEGEQPFISVKMEYDENGVGCSQTIYRSNGQVMNEETYDDKGNLSCRISYGEDGGMSSRAEYTYDDDGNQQTEIYTNEGGDVTRREYTYDSKGKNLTSIAYQKDGTAFEKTEYTYDAQGNILSETTFTRTGNIGEEYEYVRDEKENLLKVICPLQSGGIWICSEDTYDEQGRRVARTYYTTSGEIEERLEYTYDEEENIASFRDQWNYENGKAMWVQTDTYVRGRKISRLTEKEGEKSWMERFYYAPKELLKDLHHVG